MKIAYFPTQAAKTSGPMMGILLEGCRNAGLTPMENSLDADCAVIWSMLWHGRMTKNKEIFQHYRNLGKSVFIIEVGALSRGITWKIAVNNIDSTGIYPNIFDIDPDRPKKLGLKFENIKNNRKERILIASQNRNSNQWIGMPTPEDWIRQTVDEIRKYYDDGSKSQYIHPSGVKERVLFNLPMVFSIKPSISFGGIEPILR
jgi:hypothetical protein